MAFKGTLKEFKVPDILQLVAFQKKTGILTFTNNKEYISIFVEDGFIIGIDTFPKKIEHSLGNVLIKNKMISRETLQDSLAIQRKTGQKLGEALCSLGFVNKESVEEALKSQVIQNVHSLFSWKSGEYNFKVMDFHEDVNKMITPISTESLIMEGVQIMDEWPQIKKLVPSDKIIYKTVKHKDKDIVIFDEIDEDFKQEAGKIYLTEIETTILKDINSKNSVHNIIEKSIFTEYKIYKSICNLLKKRLIIVNEEAQQDLQEAKETGYLFEESHRKLSILFYLIFTILGIMVVITIFHPVKPFIDENILINKEIKETIISNEADNIKRNTS